MTNHTFGVYCQKKFHNVVGFFSLNFLLLKSGFFLGYQGTDMAVKTHKKHMLKEHPEFVKVSP